MIEAIVLGCAMILPYAVLKVMELKNKDKNEYWEVDCGF